MFLLKSAFFVIAGMIEAGEYEKGNAPLQQNEQPWPLEDRYSHTSDGKISFISTRLYCLHVSGHW